MADQASLQDEELVEEQDRGGYLAESEGGRRTRRGRGARRSRLQDASRSVHESGESLPTISFRAILATTGDPIKVGQDGESKVQVEVSASDIAEVLKLILYRGRLFTVTITSE